MARLAIAMSLLIAGCAAAPDGLLVVTDGTDVGGGAATVDVFVGVDLGLPFAELTETRPLALDPLPDDLDRTWSDTGRPYKVLLDVPTDAELYVVLRGHELDDAGAHRFGANLRAPVSYPGDGLYQVTANLYTPGDRGVCPHGTAEDAGYEVELVDATDPNGTFDCDRDGVAYPEDCVDYDTAIRPAPRYPASSGIATPDEMMCCNGATRVPVAIQTGSSGPGACNLTIGCPGAPAPEFGPREITWETNVNGFTGGFCDCALMRDPLDCIAGAHPGTLQNPDAPAQQPSCNLAVDDDGAVCPGQTWTIRAALRDHLPQAPTSCPVAIVWQAGAAALSFRSQGALETSLSTTDCDADLVFALAGPAPGPVLPTGAFGWYILEVGSGRLVAMHTHPQPVTGCSFPTECTFE